MPSIELPPVKKYVAAPVTKHDLEWAQLETVDLSKMGTPQGRDELVKIVHKAMTTQGFFFVVNHGLQQSQTDRMFDIADIPFSQVPEEDKPKFTGNIKELGSYQGYKPRNYWKVDNGVVDQIEHYNINRDVAKKDHPESLKPFMPEIREFAKFNHFSVLDKILRLMSLGMELPEDTFSKAHDFDAAGETYGTIFRPLTSVSYPRSAEDEEKTKNVWLKGHTDFGSITILWSQPVSALQILEPDGRWTWVKHIPNAIVVNAGDMIEFLSGGYYKAAVHRVVQPPPDQVGYTRLGAFYFVLANDEMKLVPFDSPVFQRVAIKRRFEDENAPTAEQWRRGRTSAYGQSESIFVEKKEKVEKVEEELIRGVKVQHWN
ncbi:Clavaminate synthase-like protein [Ramaria rubella]|nr:Clavaminate synthase-like protein [Ramaria rubella]